MGEANADVQRALTGGTITNAAPDAPGAVSAARGEWMRWVVAAVLFALPLAYAAYTQQVWEDYLITFRHSENLVRGHGLVYYPGERVHGFTSPLGVLLPALAYAVSGGRSFDAAMWTFRVLSAGALAGAGLLLGRALSRSVVRSAALAAVVAGLMLATEAKTVMYAANGQETAFMLLFLAGLLYLFETDARRTWVATGVCFAGLQWTRPDGCIYSGAYVLARMVFAGAGERRREVLLSLAKATALGAALYLPWFSWAWWYYGSPVPQTIRAKAGFVGLLRDHLTLAEVPMHLARLARNSGAIFGPPYARPGDWPAWTEPLGRGLALVAATLWMVPWRSTGARLGRAASLCFCIMCLYLWMHPYVFGWYAPPMAMLGYTAVAAVGVWLLGQRNEAVRMGAGVVLGLVVAGNALLTWECARAMRLQQAEIEDGVRKPLGLWLHEHAQRTDTVYLEPLGYIGYYSQCHMVDYPGLVAPQVSYLLHKEHRDFAACIGPLQPDWIVLRENEVPGLMRNSFFRAHYREVAVFDVRDRLAQLPAKTYAWSYLLHDACFHVFRWAGSVAPLGG